MLIFYLYLSKQNTAMPTTITGSNYISSLDSKIISSLCQEKLIINTDGSVFSAGGEAYVEGASVKIVNPLGVTIKNYPTSGYDIYPPLTEDFEYNIPTIAGAFQLGTYQITVRLTDENGEDWFIEKSVNICAPDKKNKNKKTACLNASINGNCNDGKVVIVLDQVPTYKGLISTSQVNDLTLLYPTESELEPLETTFGSFSVQLYEGEYKVSGTVCATYDAGDNVFFEVLYEVKCNKIIKCVLDECCIVDKLRELNSKLKSDCTTDEKEETSNVIFDTLRLLKTIKLTAKCGEDPSDYISELESLLGCVCTCNCNVGAPIINNEPVTDFVFEGCGFEESTVGLTKVITFYNRSFTISESEGGNWFNISEPVNDDSGCGRTQEISLNEEKLEEFINEVVDEMSSNSMLFKSVLNQSGTDAPVITTLLNTTGATWTASYLGAGDFLLTSSLPIMPIGSKVLVLSGYQLADSPMNVRWISSTEISIKSDGNGRLSNTGLYIEIFP